MKSGTKTRSRSSAGAKDATRPTTPKPRSRPAGMVGPKLSEVARHIVRPDGIVGTAWPRVRDTCKNIGWTFDRWQDGLGRLILALDGTGLYAADTSVISIPRQVGKTYLIGCIVFALALLTPGLTVIWTAHRTKTAKETFGSMKAMCATPLVNAHVRNVSDARGDEGIYLHNGSRILFGARENGFGLGFAGVGILVLDEAQRLTDKAMDDLIPTMNTVENPLILLTGTPPRPTDSGEVFTMLRQDALDGESEGTLYVEFSADEGAHPDDRAQLRKANPSYPHRTSERAIRRMRKNLTEESFLREAFGIWDKVVHRPVVTAARWRRLESTGPAAGVKPNGFGVDMSHSRMVSVNAVWLDGDQAHTEEVWAGDDTDAAVAWIADAWKRAGRRTVVVIDSESPAASLVVDLENAGVNVYVTSAANMAAACGAVENRLKAGTLTHGGQMSVTDAVVKNGKRRPIRGAGGWGWDRRNPSSQIHQAVAMTLALYGATKHKRATRQRRAETGREAVVL
ncbi:terminase large subunit [Mycobacterium phage PinkYoshi]|nr:terminase large subunit [Mycobacterium phage Frosty24]AOT25684.1 terminase large subunit [Mycobacterium phage Zombie]ASZ73094.1 terminase large subunit [Mycobacterium phage Gideon]AVO22134.1 terminase large subunit [Mycobacterium phage Remy19]AVO22197.1 terminase large subunit [Mycobacterium phage CLED96]AXC35487.1 terminase large subunit [Mycobacterium phage DMoney]AXH44718.1 terminase large subunit [Mycobacterium phage Plagueis]AXH46230.1 terminase large subunit [Mycobacterium phage Mow